MEFWNLIEEGCDYCDKNMHDYAERTFALAEKQRTDGKFLIMVIRATKNFHRIFWDDEESFDAYFGFLLSAVQKRRKGEIESDIFEYIISRLADLKSMFLKTVASDLFRLTSNEYEAEKCFRMYDQFKKYLVHNTDKICEFLGDIESSYSIMKSDIDMVIAWCCVVLLTDYSVDAESDRGYCANTVSVTHGMGVSTASTSIRRDVRHYQFQFSRLSLLYPAAAEGYTQEYIYEFKDALSACGIPENQVLQFQRDFQSKVYSFANKEYIRLLRYDPFIKKKIFTVTKQEDVKLFPYLLLAFFLGLYGVHSFYIGLKRKGALQLILTLTGIGSIVSFVWVVYDFLKALITKQLPN